MSHVIRKISTIRFCTKQRKLESKMRIYKFLCEKLGGLPIKIKMPPADLLAIRNVGCKFCKIIFLNYESARAQNENLQPTWQKHKNVTTNMAEFTANNANPDLVFEGGRRADVCRMSVRQRWRASHQPPAVSRRRRERQRQSAMSSLISAMSAVPMAAAAPDMSARQRRPHELLPPSSARHVRPAAPPAEGRGHCRPWSSAPPAEGWLARQRWRTDMSGVCHGTHVWPAAPPAEVRGHGRPWSSAPPADGWLERQRWRTDMSDAPPPTTLKN
jgi:hypothetical protein